MRPLGLKLFSTNTQLVKQACSALDQGFFQYIELFVVPGSLELLPQWPLGYSYSIHAPHGGQGVNFSDPALEQQNTEQCYHARLFADALKAKHIIVHGGFIPQDTHGNPGFTEVQAVDNICQQLATWKDSRVLLENTPRWGTQGEMASVYHPRHIRQAMESTAFGGWVLDVGHALYAAAGLPNAQEDSWRDFFHSMLALCPSLCHFSDGELGFTKDIHKNFGQGNFPLQELFAALPKVPVTLETPRNMAKGLADSLQDVALIATWAKV